MTICKTQLLSFVVDSYTWRKTGNTGYYIFLSNFNQANNFRYQFAYYSIIFSCLY